MCGQCGQPRGGQRRVRGAEEMKEGAVDNIAPTVHNCTQLYTTVIVYKIMLYQLYTT